MSEDLRAQVQLEYSTADAQKKYAGDVADANSPIILEKYRNQLNDTYVAFSGTTNMDAVNDYVRIDGTSVWRDKRTDYGGSLNK